MVIHPELLLRIARESSDEHLRRAERHHQAVVARGGRRFGRRFPRQDRDDGSPVRTPARGRAQGTGGAS